MARRSGMYGFEKRQKELKKKKKKEEKLEKRRNKPSGSGPEIDYSLCTTAEAAGVDLSEFIDKDKDEAEEEEEKD